MSVCKMLFLKRFLLQNKHIQNLKLQGEIDLMKSLRRGGGLRNISELKDSNWSRQKVFLKTQIIKRDLICFNFSCR